MNDELKGVSLVVLGIVTLLALVGLVLLFSEMKKTGNVPKAGYADVRTWSDNMAERLYSGTGRRVDESRRYFLDKKQQFSENADGWEVVSCPDKRVPACQLYGIVED